LNLTYSLLPSKKVLKIITIFANNQEFQQDLVFFLFFEFLTLANSSTNFYNNFKITKMEVTLGFVSKFRLTQNLQIKTTDRKILLHCPVDNALYN